VRRVLIDEAIARFENDQSWPRLVSVYSFSFQWVFANFANLYFNGDFSLLWCEICNFQVNQIF